MHSHHTHFDAFSMIIVHIILWLQAVRVSTFVFKGKYTIRTHLCVSLGPLFVHEIEAHPFKENFHKNLITVGIVN